MQEVKVPTTTTNGSLVGLLISDQMLSLKRLEFKWTWPEFIVPYVATVSSIEFLIAADAWTIKTVIQFLKYLPRLKRLIATIAQEEDDSTVDENMTTPATARTSLSHLEIRGSHCSTLYTIEYAFQCFSQLVIFRWFGSTPNITMIQSSQWERLISKYLPLLVKLYLDIQLYGDNVSSLIVDDVLPQTDFWIKRKWSVECAKSSVYEDAYFIVKPFYSA
ncbi:unnamed protein product [Didymodactylos carnosus]|uniref:Uncharacterized protein n=1 Tax=Didymodactylos carnosus TaxID=1234261 RepID=A0A815UXZ0_9BILA|nr:unnamed protein product [Didymodactylos carnosus]CAF1523533.1 unnamed protein product [Didymodactylos carnosus]CAF4172990.1 unnamed protein product [Didymodactylos carnosus]CAF4382648.1 unnamed protein product [Didymodactylos carnosus]